SLLRLQATGNGIELDITSRATSTLTAERPAVTPVQKAPAAATRLAARRPRLKRESRFRIRDDSEYDWYGNVGVHRPTVDRFTRRIADAAWDRADLFNLRLRGEKLATVNDFGELL